jgi:NADH-quinone oxidoreductase subunit N
LNTSTQDQLNWISDSLQLIGPELILTFSIVVLIVAALIRRVPQGSLYWFTIAALLAELVLLMIQWPQQPVPLFNRMMRTDDFSTVMRLMFAAGGLLSLMMRRENETSEYLILILSVVLGANMLVMSNNLVMVVISLEMISISSYVLTAGQELTRHRAEAAWKFFLFGSAATAVMIFGMSYLFGMTGTLDVSSTEFLELASAGSSPLFILAGLMTLGGFMFKMSAVPFHFWVPDVYESIPAPLVAFLSVVPKLAGLGATIKFSLALHLFGQSQVNWSIVLAVVAALSIVIGNLAALTQTDAKRMMAWSSVAQAGFLLAGAASFSIEGVRVTLFYAAIFLVMNFAAFVFIDAMERANGTTRMNSITGIGKIMPLPSVLVSLSLVSLTGLPPMAGFMAKLFLFSSVWEKYEASGHVVFFILLAAALAGTVISLFFYLRIPYYLFVRPGQGDLAGNTIKISLFQNLLSLILVTTLLLLFLVPGLLMGWLNKVNFVL